MEVVVCRLCGALLEQDPKSMVWSNTQPAPDLYPSRCIGDRYVEEGEVKYGRHRPVTGGVATPLTDVPEEG